MPCGATSGYPTVRAGLFSRRVATAGSLSAAARDLGISTAAESKRLAQMEARIGMPLLTRTTRRMGLTPEGEVFLEHAALAHSGSEIDDLSQPLTSAKGRPSGLLRVNATLGFGRMHVAPVIAEYSRTYPDVDVQLQLSADPPPLTEDAFDVCVRFGEPPDARIIAKFLAPEPAPAVRLRPNTCASTRRAGHAGGSGAAHNRIGIRQGSDAYGGAAARPRARAPGSAPRPSMCVAI